MPRFRTSRILLTTLLGLGLAVGATPALAQAKKAPAAKKAPVAKKAAAPAKKAAPPVSPENKKKMQDRLAGFKFGMTKDEVLATLEKQVAEKYDERLKATTDVAQQDRIRKEKRSEIGRVKQTYVTFEMNKPSPWDVSIVEEEFVHGTNEAMMERWENDGGKNNRRFFFFHEGKLWKMFIQLDVSILPEDKKNFETFSAVMVGQFGPGAVAGSVNPWSTPDLAVRPAEPAPGATDPPPPRRASPRPRGATSGGGRPAPPPPRRRPRRRRPARPPSGALPQTAPGAPPTRAPRPRPLLPRGGTRRGNPAGGRAHQGRAECNRPHRGWGQPSPTQASWARGCWPGCSGRPRPAR